MSLYKEVKKLNVREVIYTLGLGYTPVIVRDVGVLSEDAFEVVKRYVGEPVPREVYMYAADLEYVEALKRAGFKVEPYTGENEGVPIVPILGSIYGRVEGRYVVYDSITDAYMALYPSLGYYNSSKKVIHILESVADKIPIIVHEATHYTIDALHMNELGRIEESIAGLNEALSAFNAPPTPLNLLTSALNNSRVVTELEKLVEFMKGQSQIDIMVKEKKLPRNLAVLATLVEMIGDGRVHPRVVAEMIRGEKCIKDYGYVYTFTKCDNNA